MLTRPKSAIWKFVVAKAALLPAAEESSLDGIGFNPLEDPIGGGVRQNGRPKRQVGAGFDDVGLVWFGEKANSRASTGHSGFKFHRVPINPLTIHP